MDRIDWKDVGKRAVKTFVQAFVAAVGVHMEQVAGIRDLESARAIVTPILVGGVAAGISAAWNVVTGCISHEEGEVDGYGE